MKGAITPPKTKGLNNMKNRDRQRANRRMRNHLANAGIAANPAAFQHGGTPREELISYHNSERYADPTAYYAVRTIARKSR